MSSNPNVARFFIDLLFRPHRFFSQYFTSSTQRPYYKACVALWLLLNAQGAYVLAAIRYTLNPEHRHKTFEVLSHTINASSTGAIWIKLLQYVAGFFIVNYWLMGWVVRFLTWVMGSNADVAVVRSVRTYTGVLDNLVGCMSVGVAVLLKTAFPSLSFYFLVGMVCLTTAISSWGWYEGMTQLARTKKKFTLGMALCMALIACVGHYYSLHAIKTACQTYNKLAGLGEMLNLDELLTE